VSWQAALLRGVAGAFDVRRRCHLAVLAEPWLSRVVRGQKIVESRWGRVRCAPHYRVGLGDLVLMKAPGSPVVGGCEVRDAKSHELRFVSARTIVDARYEALGIPKEERDAFVHEVVDARYVTLVELSPWRSVAEPIRVEKKGRAGWVVLCDNAAQAGLLLEGTA